MSDSKIIDLNTNLGAEKDLFTPSFTLKTEGKQGVNHPVKTAKFAGKQEIEKITLEQLKFQNFDTTLEEKYINTYPEPEQLEYYKEISKRLKEQVSKGNENWIEMFKDNEKCGHIIEKLESLNDGLSRDLQKVRSAHQELIQTYNQLTEKFTIKQKIKKMNYNRLREKELKEQKQTNIIYRKELQSKQKSPVTEVMLKKMIDMRNSGKKYAEIASTLSISTATVSKHLKRNRDKLTEFQEQ